MAQDIRKYVGASGLGTAGIEGEFHLVDRHGQLVPGAAQLLQVIHADPLFEGIRCLVTPEYDPATIEAKTPPAGLLPHELSSAYQHTLLLLIAAADRLGLRLLPTAHYEGPARSWSHFQDPDGPFEACGRRYEELTAKMPVLQQHPLAAGNVSAQFHLGVPLRNEDQRNRAVAVADVLTALTPMLVAVASNSPTYDPERRLDNLRWHHWRRLPRSGPFLGHTFDGLVDHAQQLLVAGGAQKLTDLWYWVRLNAETIEVRGPDQQPTFDHLMSLWAFCYSLALTLWHDLRRDLQPVLPPITELEAIDLSQLSLRRPAAVPVWDFHAGRWSTLAQRFEWLVHYVRPVAEDAGLGRLLDHFADWTTAGRGGAQLNGRLFDEFPPSRAHQQAATAFRESVHAFSFAT